MTLGIVGGVGSVPAAQAGTCSSKTGGSSNTLMWTGSTYTCAYVAKIDDNSIGAWKTETWSSSTAPGYTKRDDCHRDSGGDVTFTQSYWESETTGSSFSQTVTNWEDGTRHYSIAVLWNTAQAGKVASNQYKDSCDGDPYPVIAMYMGKGSLTGPSQIAANTSASFTMTVTNPDGGTSPAGTVALFQQLGDQRSPKGKYCDGNPNSGVDPAVGSASLSGGKATLRTPTLADGSYKYYASYSGTPVTSSGLPSYCLTPPQSGLTGALSNTLSLDVGTAAQQTAARQVVPVKRAAAQPLPRPRITVVDVTNRAPRTITARCKSEQVAVQTSIAARKRVIEPSMWRDVRRGISLTTSSLPKGTPIHVQLMCRPATAKAVQVGHLGLGSANPDDMTTPQHKATLLGGLRGDHLTVTRTGGSAFGGPGADRITMGKAGSASGGPDRDVIRSTTAGRVLLDGGSGRDTLIGGPGLTYINAQDQSAGDTVRCKSRRTFVLADPGDSLLGTCTLAGPRGQGHG